MRVCGWLLSPQMAAEEGKQAAARPSAPSGAPAAALLPAPDGRKVRGWCFTYQLGVRLGDCSEADLKAGEAAIRKSVAGVVADTAVARCALQVEAAPDTGALHVQGYVEFQHARRFSTVAHWCAVHGFPRAHLEPRRGTPQQAWDYCVKDSTRVLGPFLHGDAPLGQGERTDLTAFHTDAKALSTGEVTLADLQETHFKVEARYTRYFDRRVARHTPRRELPTYCAVYYGDAGTGKSYAVRDFIRRYGLSSYYLRLPEHKQAQLFFDGYEGEQVVVVDEMGPNRMSVHEFNSLVDTRPHKVNIKGQAFIEFRSRLIIFTSNFPPDDWFSDDERIRLSVRRRINSLFCYSYHPDFRPDRTFSNADSVWENAIVDVKKDDSLIEQWAEEANRPSHV